MKTTSKIPLFNAKFELPIAADVSKDKSNYCCELGDSYREIEAVNSRGEIVSILRQYQALALGNGLESIVLIVEPTGGYERCLVRAATSIGVKVLYANTEAVKKLQVLQDGTSSKSDQKDPRTILTVAKVGKLMRCRNLEGRWQALRQMNAWHERLESELIRLKCRARRLQEDLFPRLPFSKQWFFGSAAHKLASLYGFSPYAIRKAGFSRASARLSRNGLRSATVNRLIEAAKEAVSYELDEFYAASVSLELAEVYQGIARASQCKEQLKDRFEAIYDELLEEGEVRIEPVSQVLPKVRLAMIHGETGPLDDFHHIAQLRRYAGMNLRLRESGTMRGYRRISKKGRPMLRKLITQTCLPLVRKGELYGEEYHARKDKGSPGAKALVAVGNKYLNMLFGLHRSGCAFNRKRVFMGESNCERKAA